MGSYGLWERNQKIVIHGIWKPKVWYLFLVWVFIYTLANATDISLQYGLLLKLPSIGFGLTHCRTGNRIVPSKLFIVVLDLYLGYYNLFWYLFCTKITLAIWVIHHHRQVFHRWMAPLCLGKRAKIEKKAKATHQATRKTPRKGSPKMTLENQRTSSELNFFYCNS